MKSQIQLGQYLDEILKKCTTGEALEWAEKILKSYIQNVTPEDVLIFERYNDEAWEAATLNGLGLTQMKKYQHWEAEKTFRTALEIKNHEGGNVAILQNLGITLKDTGRHDEGIALCARAHMLETCHINVSNEEFENESDEELENESDEELENELSLYCGVCEKAFDDPQTLTWNWGCEHAVCDDANCQVSGFV